MLGTGSVVPVLAAGFPEFLTPELQVLIWSVLVFFTLLALLWRFAWGPIMKALEQREHNIQSQIDEADKRLKDADAKVQALEKQLAGARDRAAEIMAAGKRDVEKMREEIMAQTNRESAAALERAKNEIELAKRAAVRELRDQAVDLAAEMSARVIGREVRPEDHRRFIQEAIGNIERENNG